MNAADEPQKPSLLTVVSIAVIAYATCDMIHEALGHGLACALIPGVKALSLSTVAVQTSAQNRLVAAAGSIANVIVGAVLLVLLRRRKRFGPGGYVLWLLGTINLLNGTGYLLFSGLLNVGDWAVVIAGTEPGWVWRAVLGVIGLAAYARVVYVSAWSLASFVRSGQLARRASRILVFPAYVAGGLLLVAGSARNSIDPSLILLSGVSSGFGAMFGLLLVPGIVEGATTDSPYAGPALRSSIRLALVAVLVASFFVGVLGPGIPLTPP